jgi:glyoxylase-like metal-dependent hydrolase (beta-lactamase superfamily II)
MCRPMKSFAAVIGLALSICCLRSGHAAAPMAGTQAPGFYRMLLGNFEVTALNDGVGPFPETKILTNVDPEEVKSALAKMYVTDPVDTSFNAFLINTGSKLVLIDTGMGALWAPFTGHLLANLRAAGYRASQIDEIYITHMHGDHIGGLMAGGQRSFPNAIVRAARTESEYWFRPVGVGEAQSDADAAFQQKSRKQATDLVGPYIKAGRFHSFDGDVSLIPGIRALATYGHTPGHTAYMVESAGETLVILGDLIHVGAVQFARPSATTVWDMDAKAAAAQRKHVFQISADRGYWIAGAHLSFPGIGHVLADQEHYLWIPANYTIPHRSSPALTGPPSAPSSPAHIAVSGVRGITAKSFVVGF